MTGLDRLQILKKRKEEDDNVVTMTELDRLQNPDTTEEKARWTR